MIVGTGGGGRITRDDVSNYVETQRTNSSGRRPGRRRRRAPAPPSRRAPRHEPGAESPAARVGGPRPAASARGQAPVAAQISFPAGADEVLLPMTQMRKGIAAQMTRALAIPHAYVQMEVDASGLVRLRESAKREYQAANGALAELRAVRRQGRRRGAPPQPDVQRQLDRRRPAGQAPDQHRRRRRGRRRPDRAGRSATPTSSRSTGINQAIAEVAARARANKLRLDDFGGGTFTIDNTGWLGSNLTMPIINAPEVGDPDDGGDHQAGRRARDGRAATSSRSGRS